MKPEEFFKTKNNLARYKYAQGLIEKLKEYHAQGCYFVMENSMFKEWRVVIPELTPDTWFLVGIGVDSDNGVNQYVFGLIDIQWDENPHLEPIPEIRKTFRDITVIHPKDIKKFKGA